ncbi:hypothetical protein ACKWTF_004021 [Chironomus riparius]
MSSLQTIENFKNWDDGENNCCTCSRLSLPEKKGRKDVNKCSLMYSQDFCFLGSCLVELDEELLFMNCFSQLIRLDRFECFTEKLDFFFQLPNSNNIKQTQ